jgi:hypothetical protein
VGANAGVAILGHDLDEDELAQRRTKAFGALEISGAGGQTQNWRLMRPSKSEATSTLCKNLRGKEGREKRENKVKQPALGEELDIVLAWASF